MTPGPRSGLLGNPNHPGLRPGGGTGGELQRHLGRREEQPWDAAAGSHVRWWHLPSLHCGPDLQTQPPSRRYSCTHFPFIHRNVVLKQTWRASVCSQPLCKRSRVDWLCCLCLAWPLICCVNIVNTVAAFPLLSGMRYKRRGVDADGHVANYVETEQLIHVHSHTLSFVQTRGSVPVFWSQAGYRYNPRPRLEKGQ